MTEYLANVQPISLTAIDVAKHHISDILSLAILHTSDRAAVVVYDTQCPLSVTLMEAYKLCLPNAIFINFYEVPPEDVSAAFAALVPSDLVVLIQTSSFRLNAFRLRVDLFNQSLKVIEHPHLGTMSGMEGDHYIESLAYDPAYYHGVGYALKEKIDSAQFAVIDSDGERLVFDCPLESAKLNIGDYRDMRNVGGQFPIGEVFTEAQDLELVSGRVRLFAFGDKTFSTRKVEQPITLVVEKGRVTSVIDSTPEFDAVLDTIRADEGEVWLRELGFGMNRAFSAERMITDIGTYERMCGIHLSLGKKHGVYNKPNFKRKDTWHHVDVFAVTKLVYLDDQIVYQNGAWLV